MATGHGPRGWALAFLVRLSRSVGLGLVGLSLGLVGVVALGSLAGLEGRGRWRVPAWLHLIGEPLSLGPGGVGGVAYA